MGVHRRLKITQITKDWIHNHDMFTPYTGKSKFDKITSLGFNLYFYTTEKVEIVAVCPKCGEVLRIQSTYTHPHYLELQKDLGMAASHLLPPMVVSFTPNLCLSYLRKKPSRTTLISKDISTNWTKTLTSKKGSLGPRCSTCRRSSKAFLQKREIVFRHGVISHSMLTIAVYFKLLVFSIFTLFWPIQSNFWKIERVFAGL